MKFSITYPIAVILASLAVQIPTANGFGNLRDIASSVSFTSEEENVHTVNGLTTYDKTFITYGKLTNLCFNMNEFCNLKVFGDLSWLYCFAAQKAMAEVKAGWAIDATLAVNTNQDGSINNIELKTNAKTATMAVSFAEVTAGTGVEAEGEVHVESEESANLGSSLKAAAFALGDAKASSIAISKASSLGKAQGKTETFNGQGVVVKGSRLSKFDGTVTAFASGFSQSSGVTEGSTLSGAASFAYTKALARVAEFWRHDFGGSFQKADTGAAVESFGKSFANSMAQVGVGYSIDASVSAYSNRIDISLKAKAGAFSGKVCGPSPQKSQAK